MNVLIADAALLDAHRAKKLAIAQAALRRLVGHGW
jgi:hypothetical protein